MKDFTGNKLAAGDVVVCKPQGASHVSPMRFGFVKRVNTRTIRIVCWARKYTHREPEVIEANYEPTSLYVIPTDYPQGHTQAFPEGFPEELKELYYEQFPRNSA